MELPQAMLHRGADGAVALQTLALMPPLGVAVWLGGAPTMIVLAASLGAVLAWDFTFAALRHRPFRPHGITTAAIVTLFAPPDIPLWHLLVVLSLGTVIGERVFGGRGFAFLSPATVALALGLLSLPSMTLTAPDPMIALACIPGVLVLLAFGLLSLNIAVAFLGTVIVLTGTSASPDVISLLTASSVGLVFLICDPTSTAVSSLGRVLHGVLAGGLVWVFSGTASVPTPDAIVFAALMASVFAPLLDHIAVSLNVAWRRRRYG